MAEKKNSAFLWHLFCLSFILIIFYHQNLEAFLPLFLLTSPSLIFLSWFFLFVLSYNLLFSVSHSIHSFITLLIYPSFTAPPLTEWRVCFCHHIHKPGQLIRLSGELGLVSRGESITLKIRLILSHPSFNQQVFWIRNCVWTGTELYVYVAFSNCSWSWLEV